MFRILFIVLLLGLTVLSWAVAVEASSGDVTAASEEGWAPVVDPQQLRHLAPHVIGIGVQKSGTSSTFLMLRKEKWVESPRVKELHFFDRLQLPEHPPLRASMDAYHHEYLYHWDGAQKHTECSEVERTCRRTPIDDQDAKVLYFEETPVYIADRSSPYLIRHVLPHAFNVTFLLSLREPVSRAVSGYFHAELPKKDMEKTLSEELDLIDACYNRSLSLVNGCKSYREQLVELDKCTEEFALKYGRVWYRRFTDRVSHLDSMKWRGPGSSRASIDSFLMRGMYADQIRNFLCAGFKPEQFIVTTLHQLMTDHAKVVDEIKRRFGIEDDHQPSLPHANHGSYSTRPSDAVTRRLQKFFEAQNADTIDVLLSNGFDIDRETLLRELPVDYATRVKSRPLE